MYLMKKMEGREHALGKSFFLPRRREFIPSAELPQQALLDPAKHTLALTPEQCLAGSKPIEMRQRFSTPCV
jgi:hypothetical protein